MKPTWCSYIQQMKLESFPMDPVKATPKPVPFSLLGDADPVPPTFYVTPPEQVQTLSLLYEISHEITSILDRQELLRRIAERVKKLVDYHVFTVMLWNEQEQILESVFSMRFQARSLTAQ